MEVYRLKDGMRALKLDTDGRGQFAMLSPGCLIQLGGGAPLGGFIEIICDGERLSVFREDLEDRGEKVTEASKATAEEENS